MWCWASQHIQLPENSKPQRATPKPAAAGEGPPLHWHGSHAGAQSALAQPPLVCVNRLESFCQFLHVLSLGAVWCHQGGCALCLAVLGASIVSLTAIACKCLPDTQQCSERACKCCACMQTQREHPFGVAGLTPLQQLLSGSSSLDACVLLPLLLHATLFTLHYSRILRQVSNCRHVGRGRAVPGGSRPDADYPGRRGGPHGHSPASIWRGVPHRWLPVSQHVLPSCCPSACCVLTVL